MFSLLHSQPARAHAKGFSDWINLKPITNPLGHMKDTAKAWKENPLDAPAVGGGFGKGILPSVVNSYAKVTFDPSKSYSYSKDSPEAKAKAAQAAAAKASEEQATTTSRTVITGQGPTPARRRSILQGSTQTTGRPLL